LAHKQISGEPFRCEKAADRLAVELRPFSTANADARSVTALATLNKQWSFPPRNRTFDAKCRVFSLLVTEQWRNGGDVGRGFRWKRLAGREVLFISRRTCVICRKEAC
jgi:hypothetical protein